MGPVGGSSSCQCQGVDGCASRSPPLPVLSVRDHGGRVLRQCHRGPLSTQGGGEGERSPALDTVAQGILSWAESLRIRLAPQFLPGIRNVLADSLPSSPAPQFRMVSQLGRISIFAASVAGDVRPVCHFRSSLLLHLFLALPRPSLGGDGRALPVLGGSPGVRFSAVVRSSRVLAKLRGSHWALISQYWPQRPWFMDLLQLSVAPPVPLSACPDLLFQPRPRRRYPGLHRLALHAWRLFSASPGRLVFPRRWLRWFRWRAVHHRAPPTSSSGRFTGHGAALRATPSRGHPSPR